MNDNSFIPDVLIPAHSISSAKKAKTHTAEPLVLLIAYGLFWDIKEPGSNQAQVESAQLAAVALVRWEAPEQASVSKVNRRSCSDEPGPK